MAGPLLIPDITPRSVGKPASTGSSSVAVPAEEKHFDRVQKEVAEAGRSKSQAADGKDRKSSRSELGKPQASAGPDRSAAAAEVAPTEGERDPAAGQPGTAPEAVLNVSESTTEDPVSEAVLAETKSSDPDAFALTAPLGDAVSRGNNLPTAAPLLAGPAPAAGSKTPQGGAADMAGLREMFLQMAKGGDASAKDAAGPETGIDLESFRSTLAEALDAKGSRSADTAAPTLMTSARGAELRDGSVLARQYSTTVDTPVQQGDWGDKMTGKISWLANQRISFAEIHLNPADMGPIEVRVNVQNDQATVAVHAQNASVRDLLELNGHRLREMMQDNGLNLARMDVSDQPSRQQQNGGGEPGQGGSDPDGRDGGPAAGLVSLDGEAISTGEMHLQWQSQVDTYA